MNPVDRKKYTAEMPTNVRNCQEFFSKVICVAGICNLDQRFQNGRAMKVYECIAEEERQNWNASKKIVKFNY